MITHPLSQQLRSQARRPMFWRLAKDTRGTTAVEFGMIALPFLMLAFGIMGMGLHFFTMNSLEHGVETASRQIRTGQAQTAAVTADQFKQLICNESGAIIDCAKLEVHVQTGASWNAITPQACLDTSGVQTTASGSGTDPIENSAGGAGEVVIVTACYEWELANMLGYLLLKSDAGLWGNMANGSAMIQAATTFRTEPYQ